MTKSPKSKKLFAVLSGTLLICLLSAQAFAQQKDKKQPPAPLPDLMRQTTRHETKRLGYGSTITILGAPNGSIIIEGWNKSEVDITAEIELHANAEEDFALLAQVNSFTIDKDGNHVRIISTGTHDKKFLKRMAKDFPKRLVGLPWKIDYYIRVPMMSDLDIDAGMGPITLKGVEGAISLKAVQSNAELTLTGGIVGATVASGKVNVRVASRSWRGRGMEVRLAAGDVTLELPTGFSGDVNASVLRNGKVENTYTALEPREDTTATERALLGRAGAGGAVLVLTVGDGTINIKGSDK
ncbi:MAG: hypothetical protein JO360_11105 [Acidobacteria bacterium]|nr:hypothetical protein [Acidobacteriota bacterium]